MGWKKRVTGGIVSTIGFLLSPLSWWNDLVVNVPLAVAFAWCISFFQPGWFEPSVVLGYWLTNVLGFWMMHKGAEQLLAKEARGYRLRQVLRDLATASAYTLLILILLKLHIIKPLGEIFPITPPK
ncbi:MAG TPA: hypothetical protein DCM86_11295 [Verrucomicrobiales bacterium]|nr:hypothetical protein [Verrucomicrobiales bacterium]